MATRNVHLLAAALVVASLLRADPARAWGSAGHRIVCEIAWGDLTAAARKQIRKELDHGSVEERFEDACTWADREDVKRSPRYEGEAARHYLNVAEGASTIDLARDCPSGCVVEAITTYTRGLLGDPIENRTRSESLKFLAHYVADVHQPLHVSRAKDRGGNEIAVRIDGSARDSIGRAYNLHQLWDTLLIEATGRTWQDLARRIERDIGTTERRRWSTLDPLAWAAESFALAEKEVYPSVTPGADVTRAYHHEHVDTVERRLQQAGVRLALLLERILAGDRTAIPFLHDAPRSTSP